MKDLCGITDFCDSYCTAASPSAYAEQKPQHYQRILLLLSTWVKCRSTISISLTSGDFPRFPDGAKPMWEYPRYHGHSPLIVVSWSFKSWQHIWSYADDQCNNLGLISPFLAWDHFHPWVLFLCLLLFYVIATSKVISGQVPTGDSAHSWWLYSAALLRHQATSTLTWYPTQSYNPDTEPTSLCSI